MPQPRPGSKKGPSPFAGRMVRREKAELQAAVAETSYDLSEPKRSEHYAKGLEKVSGIPSSTSQLSRKGSSRQRGRRADQKSLILIDLRESNLATKGLLPLGRPTSGRYK